MMKKAAQMPSSNSRVLLHLSLINGVGPGAIIALIKSLQKVNSSTSDWWDFDVPLDLEQFYTYSQEEFTQRAGLSALAARHCYNGLANTKILDDELALLSEHSDIRYITILDAEYPQLLREIHLPPMVLYAKGGRLTDTHLRLAIVGSRKAGLYAQQVIEKLIPDFVTHGWCIVSGGALGVDSMAHNVTIKSHGKTIVVLGSGLLRPYPESNKKLFNVVATNCGTVISPFPLTSEPERGNFPARNRIISGLSIGTLVVQAAEKSGALITAYYALDQGRQVFAVPGPITDPLSFGCHALIKRGAKLVSSVEDILEEFGQTVSLVQTTISSVVGIVDKEQRLDEQDPILRVLTRAHSIEELHQKVGLDFLEIQDKLFDLQLEGKIVQNFAGLWEVADLPY